MIYLIPIGGLCNRMRAIASYYEKTKTNDTSLAVLWEKDNNFLGCEFNDLFTEIEGVSVIDDLNSIKMIQENFKRKGRYFFESGQIANDADKRRIFRDNVEKNIFNKEDLCIKTGYSNGEEDWSIFKPNISIKNKVDSIILSKDNIIGVHIRRTDQLVSIKFSPTELFIFSMMDEIKHDNNVKFFLATDEIEEENLLRWYFGDRIISNRKKRVSRLDVEGMQDAVVDLYCLSICKKIYGSFYSSFSEAACKWNRKKDLVRIDNGASKNDILSVFRDDYECSYEKKFQIIKRMLSHQQLIMFMNCKYIHSKRLSFCGDKLLYKSYLDFMNMCRPYNLKNTGLLRIGSKNYGGYVMADILEPGIVVSVGNFYDEWNYQMAERGFSVYRFVNNDKILKQHHNIHYEKVNSYDMEEILKKTDACRNKNSILQMDVLGREWEILNDISEEELHCFKQIVIDFHDLLVENKIDYYTYVLRKLNKTHHIVHLHYNNNVNMLCFNNFNFIVANVIRLTYVRSDVDKFYPATHVFPTHLDNPADRRMQEVFIGKFSDILDAKKKNERNVEHVAVSLDVPWREYFQDAVRDIGWLRKKNVYQIINKTSSVGYEFFYPLCRLLNEYRPKNILEFNFDQATKITAQYAASHESSLTILANNRERVEHYMWCWEIPWRNTVIQGSDLAEVKDGEKSGVVYQNFDMVTKGKKYNLILLKSPLKDDVTIHMDVRSVLPDLIEEDFAVLMDHVENECGEMVFQEMMESLRARGFSFLRKDFSSEDRLVSVLFSESWKYIDEF